MKRFITMCLSAALLGGSFLAEAKTTYKDALSAINEGRMLKSYGKTLQLPSNIKTAGAKGISQIKTPATDRFAKKAPARVTADGANIYGWCGVDMSGKPDGLYSLNASDISLVWEDDFFNFYGYTLSSSVLVDGKIYGPAIYDWYGYILASSWNIYDFESGEILESKEADIFNDFPYIMRMVYNPNDNKYYATGYVTSYDGGVNLYFISGDLNNPTDIEVIEPLDENLHLSAMCINTAENCIYGINSKGVLIRLQLDGSYEELYPLNLEGYKIEYDYYFGMIYSSEEGVYYFTPLNVTEEEAYVATLDPAIPGSEKVEYSLKSCLQLNSLYSTDDTDVNPERPLAPIVGEVNFEGGSLSGTIDFAMPVDMIGGDAITGTITAYALLDDEQYKVYESINPGETLTVDYTDISAGNHKFACYVEYNGKKSRKAKILKYVGFDVPTTPTHVVFTRTSVTWDPVAKTGVNDGYIAVDDIEYIVKINGKEFGRTKDTKLDITLPEDEPLNYYTASVVAENHGVKSKPGYSNNVVAGKALSLPVNILPTEEQGDICLAVDSNEDDLTWSYSALEEAFTINTQAENGSDDWLFMPPFEVEEGDKYLTLSYEATIRLSVCLDERLEVYVGKADNPEAMTKCIVQEYSPEPFVELREALIPIDDPGVYYVGFHCTSDPDQAAIDLRNIKIEDTNITTDSPAAPSAISAIVPQEGVLSAEVSLTLPEKTLGGENLPADAELVATITSPVATETVKGVPGEEVKVNIATSADGLQDIYASVALGDLNSPKVSTSVFTILYAPAAPEITDYEVSDDMLTLSIKWSKVTEGAYPDAYVNPDDITYNVYLADGRIWNPIATGLTDLSYVYSIEAGTPLTDVTLGVAAVNGAGNSAVSYVSVVLGTPYDLPIEGTFENGKSSINPWMAHRPDDKYSATWNIQKLSYYIDVNNIDDLDGESYGLVSFVGPDQLGQVGMPLFSTVGQNAVALNLKVYTGPYAANLTISGVASENSDAEVILGTTEPTDVDGFTTVTFQLPNELLGKSRVQIYITASSPEGYSIGAISEASVLPTSAVKELATNNRILAGKGSITVAGFEGQNVTIASVDGAIVANGVANSNSAVYNVMNGIYIVKAGNKTAKVIVK